MNVIMLKNKNYYYYHIQNPKNKSSKSNISKTVRDRQKVSMEVKWEVMNGVSNGGNISDPRWLLKVKVKPWKLWSRISKNTVRDKEKQSIESVNSLLWRPIQLYLRERGKKFWGTLLFQATADIHIQNLNLKSNISKTVWDREEVSMAVR